MQQAQSMVPFNRTRMAATQKSSECIKVCVRVRPLLPRELGKDEVVYFPSNNSSDNLEVSCRPS